MFHKCLRMYVHSSYTLYSVSLTNKWLTEFNIATFVQIYIRSNTECGKRSISFVNFAPIKYLT